MFEATGWKLEEPSETDATKYDGICPTFATWQPEENGEVGKVSYILNYFSNKLRNDFNVIRWRLASSGSLLSARLFSGWVSFASGSIKISSWISSAKDRQR